MHNYTGYYDRHLKHIYETKGRLNILEIGVDQGNSVYLWRKCFPKANIVGMDIKDVSRKPLVRKAKIDFVIGDQIVQTDLDRVIAKGPYDVIIDDGCHHPSSILTSFKALWPALRQRGQMTSTSGIYVIEDCFHSYKDQQGVPELFTGLTEKIRDIYRYKAASVCFYPNICFIEKT